MSERNIKIVVAATGGDQAAAEVRKVESASVEAAAGLNGLHAEGKKVTAGAVNMKMGIQNVAFQIQDMAVQAEMGVPAMRILSQQMTQLLGGFGMWGAVAGGVIALGAPLAAALMGPGDAAEKSNDKVKDFTEQLEDLKKKAAEVAAEKSGQRLQGWLDGLMAEEEIYRDQNMALARQIDLLRERNNALAAVDAAETEARIAAVEADPSKSEADKIREIAKIRDEEAARNAQRKKDELALTTRAAEDDARAKQDAFERANEDQLTRVRRISELEAERSGLRGRIARSNAGATAVPQLEQKIEDTLASQRRARAGAQGNLGEETERRFAEEIADLKARLEEQRRASQEASVEDRKRVAVIDSDIALIRKEEESKRAPLDAARVAAKEAAAQAAQAAAVQQIRSTGIDAETSARSRARNTSAAVAATNAEAAAAGKRAMEEAQAERERLQGTLDGTARGDARKFRNAGRNVGGDLGKTLENIGGKMADGTNEQEIEKLSQQFIAATQGMGGATIEAMRTMLETQRKQAAEIEVLKAQIKNARTKPGR